MTDWHRCRKCGQLAAILDPQVAAECGACGSKDAEIVPADQVKKGLEAGAYYNIDPRTGGRAKKKRKR
jgi:predicted  nucleic acid-binding Zn-ribbon protein